MDLETPTEANCLLCGDETVEIKSNSAEKPMFYCETFGSVVNLRTVDGEKPQSLLNEAVEGNNDESDTLESTETDEETDETGEKGTTLADLMGDG